MEKKRVLIFPCGAENALEIADALRYNVNVEVFGASGRKDFSEYKYDKEHYIEGDFYYQNHDFHKVFSEMLENYRIDIIIPTHDDIALYFAEHKDEYTSRILVSDKHTALICRSKRLTYERFRNFDFCPVIYENSKELRGKAFPFFYKPDKGVGAVGTRLIYDEKQLRDDFFAKEGVLCEFLPGKELTVDCFTNRNGKLLFAGARVRDRIVMGIAFRSTAVDMTDEISRIATIINRELDFFGAWYFQVKQDVNGKYKLLEISCRQSSGMSLYRHMGINFPMLGIFELYGIDTSYVRLEGNFQFERRINTLYKTDISFRRVYLDFDDTLVIDNKVCLVVIKFLYQCVNEDKRLVLLTRHEGELPEIMDRFKFSSALFDKIIHISFDEDKTDYIEPEGSIFIDNSYAERKAVHDRFGIPVFDVDSVDMLLSE